MVIKTEVCAFSEARVYPGHGIRYVRKDGQLVTFFSSKTKSLYLQRKKPAKLCWTVAWRRLNKKTRAIDVSRRKRNRARPLAPASQTLSPLDAPRAALYLTLPILAARRARQ